MKTILMAAWLMITGAYVCAAEVEPFTHFNQAIGKSLEHSEKLLKGEEESTEKVNFFGRYSTAASMREQSKVNRYKLLTLLKTPEETFVELAGDRPALLKAIRKNFCDEAARDALKDETLNALVDNYIKLLGHEGRWEAIVVKILDAQGTGRPPGVNPGDQKKFFNRDFKGSTLPTLPPVHDDKGPGGDSPTTP